MAKKILIRFAIVLILIITPVYAAGSWLLKINKVKITKEKFDKDYETFLFLFSMQMGLPIDQVHTIIDVNKKAAPEYKDSSITTLEKREFLDRYEEYIAVQEYVKEKKYKSKRQVRQRLNFIINYYTNQMFLTDQVNKMQFDFTEDYLLKMWVKEKEINSNLNTVPISDGIKLMEKKATQVHKKAAMAKLLEKISKKYKIQRNKKVMKQI